MWQLLRQGDCSFLDHEDSIRFTAFDEQNLSFWDLLFVEVIVGISQNLIERIMRADSWHWFIHEPCQRLTVAFLLFFDQNIECKSIECDGNWNWTSVDASVLSLILSRIILEDHRQFAYELSRLGATYDEVVKWVEFLVTDYCLWILGANALSRWFEMIFVAAFLTFWFGRVTAAQASVCILALLMILFWSWASMSFFISRCWFGS